MTADIIWLICTWGCAALFTGFSLYARRLKKPMWFWSGSEVPSYKIKDIPAYNKANGIMWSRYSVPFWISGISFFWYRIFAVVLLVLACTVGIIWLIRYYEKISKKYER